MIEQRGDSGLGEALTMNVERALVSTCIELVRAGFWSLVDGWRERSNQKVLEKLAHQGYVPCPVCDAGDNRNNCKACHGYGCVTFTEAAEFETGEEHVK